MVTVAGLAVVTLALVLYGVLRRVPADHATDSAGRAGAAAETSTQIEALCSSCHVFPPPQSLPRENWPKEVELAFGFIRAAYADLTNAPSPDQVLEYFQARAPVRLPLPPLYEKATDPSVTFEPQGYVLGGHAAQPGIANVRYAELSPPHERVVVACDMKSGLVLLLDLRQPDAGLQVIAHIPHPAHAEPVDLDRDGYLDLLVADLGSLMPSNHTDGKVMWLRRDPRSDAYEPLALAQRLGRVADVQPADFDGDGDLDLVVAAFGWRTVGELLLLENDTADWVNPRFNPTRLEQRTGTIHVPVADLNNDRRPDFVALFSQEHEQVAAFLNEGGGRFARQPIFQADNPDYGSSGIQLVDFDGDDDLDVLYTNGDSLDNSLIKPYHGVQWLENEGRFPFTHHHLTALPGVHRAVAADVDADGDQDVVACAFLPNVRPENRAAVRADSLIWLENRAGQFTRHSLESERCDHATLDVADADADGDLDLIVGNFLAHDLRDGSTAQSEAWITVWRNRLR